MEALNPIFSSNVLGRDFVLYNFILIFDTKEVYVKLQITNPKNEEVTAIPRPQSLK